MHALSPCKCPVESFFDFIQSPLGVLWAYKKDPGPTEGSNLQSFEWFKPFESFESIESTESI